MRWKHPEFLETRIKTRFLIFPKTIENETRWLEKATWKEMYIKGLSSTGKWEELYWIKEQYIREE